MLTAYALPSQEVSQEYASEHIEDAVWVDAVDPTDDEISTLQKKFGIFSDDIIDCLDKNERSRFDSEEEYMMLILRVLAKDDDPTDLKYPMEPVGFFLTRKNLITVHSNRVTLPRDPTSDLRKRKTYPKSKEELLYALIRRFNRDIERCVRNLEIKIEAIQSLILKSIKTEVINDAFTLNNSLILLNTSILSNANAINAMRKNRLICGDAEMAEIIEDIEIDTKQLYEMTNIHRELVSNTLDAYSTTISNNLNHVMKLIASLSLILMLPTLIASLYGMNVKLPFQDSPDAFMFVIGMSLFSSAILWIAFRKYGFM